eukprot:2055413-Alexandrium_andersonii.AAC.1
MSSSSSSELQRFAAVSCAPEALWGGSGGGGSPPGRPRRKTATNRCKLLEALLDMCWYPIGAGRVLRTPWSG